MNDPELAEWLDIPLSRIKDDVAKLTEWLIKSRQWDSRSAVGDALIRIEGQLEQIRQNLPDPREGPP